MNQSTKALRDAREALPPYTFKRTESNGTVLVEMAEAEARVAAALAHQAEQAEAGEAKAAWQVPPPNIRVFIKAAIDLIAAVDARHDGEAQPLKYTVPWGALTGLRYAVGLEGVGEFAKPEWLDTPSPTQASEPPQQGDFGPQELIDGFNDWWGERDEGGNARVAAWDAWLESAARFHDVIPLATPPASEAPATAGLKGWKLVPIEPTEAMLLRGGSELSPLLPKAIWAAMLAASPADPEGGAHGR